MRKLFSSLAGSAITLAVLVPASPVNATPGQVVIVEKPVGTVSGPVLREALKVIAKRLSGIGIAGAAVYIQGNDIVIELPKAPNDTQVEAVLGQTAQVFFRPVDCIISPYAGTTRNATARGRGVGADRTTALTRGHGSPAPLADITSTTLLRAAVCKLTSAQQEHYLPPHGNSHGVTSATYDTAGATVVLPGYAGYSGGRYVLGPAEMTGGIVETAAANLNSQTDEWAVDITFTREGSALFNKYATAHFQCYTLDESNPPYCALQAIELDATVESAPAIEAPSFPGGATIDGSASKPFTAQQASDLALALRYGALPVHFIIESIETISPSSTSPTAPPSSTSPTAPGLPVAVPFILAPTNVGCPDLDGESRHYTHFAKAPPMCINPAKTYTAKIVTDVGTMTVKFATAQDAAAVNNFIFLAGYHFFDGTVFHRVCTGFVDQGGDPTGTGTGGPGYSFNGGVPKSSKVYTDGALAMANSGSASADGSQFFIVVGNGGPTSLAPNYSYFGQVTAGLSVVNAINHDGSSAAATNGACAPRVVHKIIDVTITEP